MKYLIHCIQCRAGYKLEAAIEQLKVDVNEKVVLDSGLSTGGFTDCLLQHGAAFVYGIDVGYGQVLLPELKVHLYLWIWNDLIGNVESRMHITCLFLFAFFAIKESC